MKELTKHDLHCLRHRFVQDLDLPIQVLENPYFEERLALFDKEFNAVKLYHQYVETVMKKHDGDITKFLEDYHSLRDRISGTVANSEPFKEFNADDSITAQIKEFKPIIGERNLYNQEQVKKGSNAFLSIDLRKANFQTLRYINPAIVMDCNTYEEFMAKFTDDEIAAKSKKTRQIIFGKLNPNRTMKFEKILIAHIEEYIRKYTNILDWFELYSMNSDELIYKFKQTESATFKQIAHKIDKNLLEETIRTNIGLNVRAEFFNLNLHTFKTAESENFTYVYTKDFIDGGRDFKCANEIYFTQTYKLMNDIEIKDNDLVFYYNKTELAKFLKPLVKV